MMTVNKGHLHLQNIHFAYEQKRLFSNLSIVFPAYQWSCLLGPSGVGKTTLLRLILGLLQPQKGQIYFEGSQSLYGEMAYLAQQDDLLPWLSVLENVLLPCQLAGKVTAKKRVLAKQLLEQVGLAKVAQKRPQSLSGGMRQRAALCRTLIQEQEIIILDEPFARLDVATRLELQSLAFELLQNKTVIMVTHDPLEALRLANKLFILSKLGVSEVATLPTQPLRAVDELALIERQAQLLKQLQEAKGILSC